MKQFVRLWGSYGLKRTRSIRLVKHLLFPFDTGTKSKIYPPFVRWIRRLIKVHYRYILGAYAIRITWMKDGWQQSVRRRNIEESCVCTHAMAPARSGLGLALGMAIFFLLTTGNGLHAQTNTPDSIRPLQIGDTIPEILWHLPLQVVNHPDGRDTITLNDYKGKLIILDFWATWCVPCIKSLYKLDSIQVKFTKDLQVIPLTYEPPAKVRDFFVNHKLSLFTSIEPTGLRAYFPREYIPHQVWVEDGLIAAITDGRQSSEDNIRQWVNGKLPKLKTKEDLVVDYFAPVDQYAKQGGADIYFRSTLTGYIEGTGGIGRKKSDNQQAIYAFNRTILEHYISALRIPRSEIIVESRNVNHLVNPTDTRDNVFCYQLLAPADLDAGRLQAAIVDDLNHYFGLWGRFETRSLDCYVIKTRTSTEKAHKGNRSGKPYGMHALVRTLNYTEKWQPDPMRFVDESSFEGKVYLDDRNDITAFRNDIPYLRSVLADHGLELSREERNLPVFVIGERKPDIKQN